ncbi:PQQ-binding-like beta-propeller repeat protein [Streptomyces sp. NPDC048507]|uniref:outer membrane protein assembly factor BamB family protein n=1 Tax=Streptomyces sp. NPDC048507 TaxID=3365560 RepID=UPI0037194332
MTAATADGATGREKWSLKLGQPLRGGDRHGHDAVEPRLGPLVPHTARGRGRGRRRLPRRQERAPGRRRGHRHPPVGLRRGRRMPAFVEGVVHLAGCVATTDSTFHGVDAATGVKKWSLPIDAITRAAPAVSDGVVYVGDWKGRLSALDAATGWCTCGACTPSTRSTPPPEPGGGRTP